MQIINVNDSKMGGKKAFELIKEEIDAKKVNTLGLATGSTPISLYEEIRQSNLDFSNMTSINLDEYVGLSATNVQSYAYFMNENLFATKPFAHSYLPNGLATDATSECKRYDELIQNNPVDIQILGIGSNGHIGFNEPGTSFETQTHVVDLTESTINANKRFFSSINEVPKQAYSMGIKTIMAAKKIILMAYGENKAEAVRNMVKGPVTEDVPASILQQHNDTIIIVDKDASKFL